LQGGVATCGVCMGGSEGEPFSSSISRAIGRLNEWCKWTTLNIRQKGQRGTVRQKKGESFYLGGENSSA